MTEFFIGRFAVIVVAVALTAVVVECSKLVLRKKTSR